MQMPTEDNMDDPEEPIITIEEEEDVVLFWDLSKKSKGIRELSMGVKARIKEDQEVLQYYRLVIILFLRSIFSILINQIKNNISLWFINLHSSPDV